MDTTEYFWDSSALVGGVHRLLLLMLCAQNEPMTRWFVSWNAQYRCHYFHTIWIRSRNRSVGRQTKRFLVTVHVKKREAECLRRLALAVLAVQSDTWSGYAETDLLSLHLCHATYHNPSLCFLYPALLSLPWDRDRVGSINARICHDVRSKNKAVFPLNVPQEQISWHTW